MASGDFTSGFNLTINSLGALTLVQIQDFTGTIDHAYIVSGSMTSVSAVQLATGASVVGGDARDGSCSVPVWSRTVSSSGFGAETSLPPRASALSASAGRTAIMGRSGVSVYDHGSLQHTFSGDQVDLSDVQLSGPHVVERLLDASNDAYTKVSKADGTQTQQFTGWPSGVFGSQYVSTSVDALPTGSTSPDRAPPK